MESSGCAASIRFRQEVTQPSVRPAVHDAARDEVQIGARVDVVRDAGADDGQNIGRAGAAEIEPGEKPIASSEDEPAQLALAPVVRQLDVAVVEKEQEPVHWRCK